MKKYAALFFLVASMFSLASCQYCEGINQSDPEYIIKDQCQRQCFKAKPEAKGFTYLMEGREYGTCFCLDADNEPFVAVRFTGVRSREIPTAYSEDELIETWDRYLESRGEEGVEVFKVLD